MSINAKELNEEVLFTLDTATRIDRLDLQELKARAWENHRKKIRLCAHHTVDDPLHEMFVVQFKETYGRPHRHLNKIESLHVIEGSADLVAFDEEGNITGLTPIGDVSSGRSFYHRIADESFHALVFHSDVLIFHESKTGPWVSSDPVWAPWAPAAEDVVAAEKYMDDLRNAAASFAAPGLERG